MHYMVTKCELRNTASEAKSSVFSERAKETCI